MQKRTLLLLLVHLAVCPDSLAFSFSECCDAIKDSVVSRLPEKWQKKADKYFWPGVGACATLTAVGAYCVLREPREPREIFTDLLGRMYDKQPHESCIYQKGAYRVGMHVFEDGSGLTVHLSEGGKKLYAEIREDSLFFDDIKRLVDIAMARLPQANVANN